MKTTLVSLLLLAAALLSIAGCEKDPQVMVTPFVLKSETPTAAAPPSDSGIQACTGRYEQAPPTVSSANPAPTNAQAQ